MPFPDELQVVELVEWSPQWAADFERLARELRNELGGVALAIEHIGSTAVPGLAAKDVIDVQVLAEDVSDPRVKEAFARLAYRRRPEPWNQFDVIGREQFLKSVYAPPPDARPANVHVRGEGSGSARYALLFRDFLRADADARAAWAELKSRTAAVVDTLAPYGQIKAAALPLLMHSAEEWAAETGWPPRD